MEKKKIMLPGDITIPEVLVIDLGSSYEKFLEYSSYLEEYELPYGEVIENTIMYLEESTTAELGLETLKYDAGVMYQQELPIGEASWATRAVMVVADKLFSEFKRIGVYLPSGDMPYSNVLHLKGSRVILTTINDHYD